MWSGEKWAAGDAEPDAGATAPCCFVPEVLRAWNYLIGGKVACFRTPLNEYVSHSRAYLRKPVDCGVVVPVRPVRSVAIA